MPLVTIRQGLCGGRAISIRTDDWPAGAFTYRWDGLLASVLVHAFLERPIAIISLPGAHSPTFASFRRGFMTPVHRRPRFPLPFGSYWIGVADSCPEAFLWSIADEDEFELGELWVTSIPRDDLARADALVRAEACADLLVPNTSEEVVAVPGNAVGRELVWLNATRPFGEIADAVREIAERRGWTVETI